MSLGDVFTATFSVFRRRIGAFLGLTGLQQLVTGVAVMVPFALGAIVLFPVLLTGSRPSNTSIGLGLLLVLGGFFVAAVALGIVTLYFDGMMITCANEATQGRFPTMSELRALNRGYVGRIIGLYILAMLAYLVAVALVFLPFIFSFAGMMAVINEGSSSSQNQGLWAMLSGMGVSALLMVVVAVGAFVISVKLAYVAQVCAVERVSGFTALRRAMNITKGAFWRTLGYLLVFSLAAGAAQQAVSFVMNFATSAISPMTSQSSESAVLDMVRSSSFMIMIAAVCAVALVIQVVIVPLRHVFLTVMYGDQLRRQQLGPVNHAFAVNVPGYGPAPYGQPGYPQQPGYPPQPGYGPQQPTYGAQPGYGPYGRDLYGEAPGQQPPYGEQPPYGQG